MTRGKLMERYYTICETCETVIDVNNKFEVTRTKEKLTSRTFTTINTCNKCGSVVATLDICHIEAMKIRSLNKIIQLLTSWVS